MEDVFLITGGKPLHGSVALSGAKNVALKVIIASLLLDGPSTLTNVPCIQDVFELLELLKKLGATVEFTDPHTLVVDPTGLSKHIVDLYHGSQIRVSFMLFAPLLAKLGLAHIPNPGGCRLGARSIDRIVHGMESYGVTISYNHETGYYEAKKSQDLAGSYTFTKKSHTGTETLLMLGAKGNNDIIIDNAAPEPEVDYLIQFLNEAGARIGRVADSIIVKGAEKLVRTEPFAIPPDRNEAVTYAVAALATQGDVTISPIRSEDLGSFINTVKEAGGGVDIMGESIRFHFTKPLTAVSIETSEYPGFMTDWQPLWAVLMTQAKGVSRIHERLFENRFGFVTELQKLGAHIEYPVVTVADPKEFYAFNWEEEKEHNQVIDIAGGHQLHNGVLEASDLRAGATLIIAALVAEGESVVQHARVVDRGYEGIVEKLQALGGTIQKA